LTRIVVIAVLLGAGASRADDTGLSQGIAYGLAGIAAGIFDTAFTIYDVAKLSQGQPGNRYAGVVEVLGAAPQIVVASIVMANPPPWDPAGPLCVVWALWAGALTAHGIWSIAAVHPPETMQMRCGPTGCAGIWRF